MPPRRAANVPATATLPTMAEVTADGLTADEVPQEVKDYIEKAYADTKERPDARFRLVFGDIEDPTDDDIADANKFIGQARTYCETREAGKLTFRRLTVKDDDEEAIENVVQFRVTEPAAGKPGRRNR